MLGELVGKLGLLENQVPSLRTPWSRQSRAVDRQLARIEDYLTCGYLSRAIANTSGQPRCIIGALSIIRRWWDFF